MIGKGTRTSRRALLCLASLVIVLLVAGGILLRGKREREFRRRHGIPKGCSSATVKLFKSVLRRDVDGVRKWASEGGDVNVRSTSGTPLLVRWARVIDIYDDDLRMGMVEVFIQAGADVNAADRRGETALEEFTDMGHPDVANRLIAAGARADIFVAATLGRIDLVTKLLADQPDLVNARQRGNPIRHWKKTHTPLHHAFSNLSPNDVKMAEFLLSKGADVNAIGSWGTTPLHQAAQMGLLRHAELYIEHGADLNAQDEKGYTPLHNAVVQSQRSVAKLLLLHGADVNIKNKDGKTPLDMGSHDWHEKLRGEIRAESSMAP